MTPLTTSTTATTTLQMVDRSADTDAGTYSHIEEPKDGVALHHTGSLNEDGDRSWLCGGALRYSLQTFKDKRAAVSTTLLIRRSGLVEIIVRPIYRAWHAGYSMWKGRSNCNAFMEGWEICNDGRGETFSDAQYEAVSQLFVARHYPDDMVASHQQIRDQWLAVHPGTDTRKTDPLGWDWQRFRARVAQLRANAAGATAPRLFPQTGFSMQGAFRSFFEAHGDIAQFGFPISPVFEQNGLPVQYTQRARFEDHSGTVMLGLVGAEVLISHGIAPGRATMAADIQRFYDGHGGPALLGLPVRGEITETLSDGQPYTVQYFERARVERHPEAGAGVLMLGLLGAEALSVWRRAHP